MKRIYLDKETVERQTRDYGFFIISSNLTTDSVYYFADNLVAEIIISRIFNFNENKSKEIFKEFLTINSGN